MGIRFVWESEVLMLTKRLVSFVLQRRQEGMAEAESRETLRNVICFSFEVTCSRRCTLQYSDVRRVRVNNTHVSIREQANNQDHKR